LKINSKVGAASGLVDQTTPWSAQRWNTGLWLTIAETEKLSHVGLQWIQLIGDQVVTRKRQRKSWVSMITRLPGHANLQSAYQGHYDVPHAATGLGEQSFAVAGPKAWNSLSSELRCIAVDSTFRHHLKAELFSRAYDVSVNI